MVQLVQLLLMFQRLLGGGLIKLVIFLENFLPSFQFNVLQRSSHVTIGNVSNPLGNAMVIMIVGIIRMKETVQVKCSLDLHTNFVRSVRLWNFKDGGY